MERLFTALYAAGHKSFDLPTERLVALLRVTLTLFCLVAVAKAPGLGRQIVQPFELILAAYALFGLGVALLPLLVGSGLAGSSRCTWSTSALYLS